MTGGSDVPKPEEFRCLRCGECCRRHGYVRVTSQELDAIAGVLHISTEQLIEEKTCLLPDRSGLSLTEYETGECIFYDLSSGGCLIQEVKPQQCKDFPFRWRYPDWEKVCAGGREWAAKKADGNKVF